MLTILSTLIHLLDPNILKTARDGRLYYVLDGRCKYLPKGAIQLESPACSEASSPKPINNKEDRKMIFHLVRVHKIFGEIRVITNSPANKERQDYEKSLATGQVVNNLFAIRTGVWGHIMLQERLANKGKAFRVTVVQNKCINPGPMASKDQWTQFHNTWKDSIGKVNFAVANANVSFFMQFQDEEASSWGLQAMGLDLLDAAKSAKRANEIFRIAKEGLYTEDLDSIKVLVVHPDSVNPKAVDGMTYISKTFALRMTDRIQDEVERNKSRDAIINNHSLRKNFRMVVPANFIDELPEGGMIKGDCTVRDDKFMGGYDVRTVVDNLKKELRATEPFIVATAIDHHPVHAATWDIQRHVMNPQILTEIHRDRDLKRFVEELKASINSGIIPEWILLSGNESHEDGALPVRENFRDFDTIALRLQAAGVDVRAAQNVVRLAISSVINQMGKEFAMPPVRGVVEGYARRLWLPKSNAFVALINTHGSLTKVGNFRSKKFDGKKSYFMRHIGLILTDERMVELYDLLGGADLDDSVEIGLVKVWSSDSEVTGMLRRNGVIGKQDRIPTEKAKARYLAYVLRSPNGVGEYGFIDIENILDLPWQLKDLDNVEVIDLATLPLPQAEAMKKSKILGMQPSIKHSGKSVTRSNALRQIVAQQFNPGIGSAANALMALAGSAGPSMPGVMVAPFEQLVDAVQQMSDPALFKAVERSAELTSSFAIQHLVSTGHRVDSYLVPRFFGEDQLDAQALSYEGPMAKFLADYRDAIKDIYDTIEMKTLQMRDVQPVVQWARSLKFGAAARLWAQDFIDRHNKALRAASREPIMSFDGNVRIQTKLAKQAATMEKHARMRKAVDEAVMELMSFDLPGQRALAVWAQILRPAGTDRMGSYDRLMFQPGTGGVAIMDVLLPVLAERRQDDGTWK